MTAFDFSDLDFAVRSDMGEAYTAYWGALAAPGNWWTGAERVAIAEASREALNCEFCVLRKQSLSPHGVDGKHKNSGPLSGRAVDAVHRIITDQSRITQTFVDDNAANDLSKEAYVELVGIVVTVFSIDEFHRALGVPLPALPEPQLGQPSCERPGTLADDMGFVPTIPADGATGDYADLWAPESAANVVRALSLVPDAVRGWQQIAGAQYLSLQGMQNFAQDDNRSINRMQMELIAGRVSSVNECFY